MKALLTDISENVSISANPIKRIKQSIRLLTFFVLVVVAACFASVNPYNLANAQDATQNTGATQDATQTTGQTTVESFPLVDISRLAEYIGAPRRLFVNTDIAGEPTVGDPETDLVLVEFSDFNCSSCARFHTSSLPELVKNYVDTGKMRFVYRDFVGVGGNISMNASLAGNCLHDQVGTSNYFPLINEFYGTSGRKSMTKLLELANQRQLEYYAEDLLLCIEDKVFSAEVYDDINAAYAIGIRGTPAFILGYEASDGTVDGLLLLGAAPYERFAALIDQFIQTRDVIGLRTDHFQQTANTEATQFDGSN